MTVQLKGISSMATRALLRDLTTGFRALGDVDVAFESVGGVDAAKRVSAGEAFDIVALAADAIDKLAAAGHVDGSSKVDFAKSVVALAVRAGRPKPPLTSSSDLRAALLSAGRIGYSTGPSGTALLKLFENWGIARELTDNLVQAPPGVPVGKLLADGKIDIAFQQNSELIGIGGIDIVGALPEDCRIVTIFSAARAATSREPAGVSAFLGYLASPATARTIIRHAMMPV